MNYNIKDIKGYEGLYKITSDGKVWSEKSKKLKGCPKTLEHRLKISLSHIGKSGLKGKDNPMFGKKHSPETRAKISKRLKESWKNKSI